MGILVALGINIALWLAAALWKRYATDKSVEGLDKNSVSFPTNEQGARRPLAYGRVLVRRPVILAYGDPDVDGSDPDHVKWYASIHYGICATNVIIADDQENYAWLLGVFVDGKKLRFWDATDVEHHQQNGEYAGITGPLEWIVTDAETTTGKNNYWGMVEFHRGEPSLTMNSLTRPYRQTSSFYNRLTGTVVTDGSNFSPYRGLVGACLTAPPWDPEGNTSDRSYLFKHGFRFPSSSIPPIAFEIYNPVAIPGVNPAFMDIAGDANPAGVLYDLLINKTDGRLGYDPALIDITSFGNAALVLWIEQNGYSRVIYGETEVKNIIREIEQQIDGVLYEDPETGLWCIALTREDYSVELLPHYKDTSESGSPANIISVVGLENIGWTSVANTVRCRFTAREIAVKESDAADAVMVPHYDTQVAEAKNQAVAALAESTEAVDIEYPGVSNATQAGRIATRDLRALSLPLARATIQVNRAGFNAYPNQVVKATHAEWGGSTIVFRVVEVDIGEFESNTITLDLLQDRWAVDYSAPEAVPFPPVIGPSLLPAVSPEYAVIEEAPYFWLNLALQLGQIPTAAAQRLWYFVKAEGDNLYYRGGILVNEIPIQGLVSHTDDTARVSNGGTFQVAADYSRINDPYDTTVGLLIRNLNGWTPRTATSDEIQSQGINVLYINGELLAYENFTDQGGGEYLLEDVWRGLAGTVPRDHDEEDGYGYVINPVQSTIALGSHGVIRTDEVDARVSGSNGQSWSPYNPSEFQAVLTIRKRLLLPGTPADLKAAFGYVHGVFGTPGKELNDGIYDGLVVDGLDFTFKGRDRTVTELIRGDSAAETQPDSGTYFRVVAIHPDGTEYVTADSSTDIDEFDMASLSAAGCGPMEVGIQSYRAIVEGGVATTLTSWQTPTLPAIAYEFRNLLKYWMFQGANFGPHWVAVSGNPAVSGSGPSANSQYVQPGDSSGTVEFRQTVDVHGWRPMGMRAVLEFLTVQLGGDSNDDITITLRTLDDASSVLDTATYGVAVPTSTWTRQICEIEYCDPDTYFLRVNVLQDAEGELDTSVSAVTTEFNLMLGQFTDGLLTNTDFESGLTGWTTSLGGFTDETSNARIGTHRIQGQANGTNSVYQEVAVPAGYQHSYAVLRASIWHPSGSIHSAGQITVQARAGAGGTVLASGTYSMTPAAAEEWYQLLTYCEVPHGATYIRVILQGNRLAGEFTDNLISFDDASLRIHKKLVPSWERTFTLTPAVQERPRNITEWEKAYPSVGAPTYGMFVPGGTGNGNEPLVYIRGTTPNGLVHGIWDSDDQISRPAWELRRGETSGLTIQNPTFAAFSSAQSFTVRVMYDLREQNTGASARILACRYDADQSLGWVLGIDASNRVYATIYGAGGTATVNAGDAAYYGPGPTFAAIVHDAAADTLRVVTPNGNSSTSTAAIGDFVPDLTEYVAGVSIGWDPNGTSNDTPNAMIIGVDFWRVVVTASALQDTLWTYGSLASQPGSILERGLQETNAVVATEVGVDGAGDTRVAYWGRGVDVQGRPGDTWGLACARNRTSLVVSDMNLATNWATGTGTTVTLSADIGPDGSRRAVSIVGTSSHYREHTAALGSGSIVNVTFFAKAATAGNAQVQLRETDGTVIDTETVALTTNWQRIDLRFSGWVQGTASGVFRFIPSDSGTSRTLYIAGPFFVDQDQSFGCPIVIPVHGSSRTRYTYEALAIDAQWNLEGEIDINARAQSSIHDSGILVDCGGAAANGRTVGMYQNDAYFTHYKQDADDETVISLTEDWSDDQNIRGRWNKAGLLDVANAHISIVTASGPVDGMTSTTGWTKTDTELDTMSIGKADGVSANSQCEFVIYDITLRGREKLL